jgi:hypothetical protein
MSKQAKTGAGPRGGGRLPGRATVQYTVRDVPAEVDRALRRKASTEGKSLNHVLRDALARDAGTDPAGPDLHHDLDALAGTWDDDPDFDRAVADQDVVDDDAWR